MHNNLTEGRIGSTLLLFSLPLIFANLLQQLYNVADTFIVGQTIGATALSAVGSSSALMVLLTSILLGLCMGSGVVFAQLYGAKRMDDFKCSLFNAFLLLIVASVCLNLLAALLLEPTLQWLHVPPEAVADTRTYLRILFVGLSFVSLYHFIAAILRSIGNTVVPLLFLAGSALGNIALDLLFILVFHWGVAGAAWATVLAQAAAALTLTLYFLCKAKELCPTRTQCRPHRPLLRTILRQSTLTALQQSIMNFGILMVQGLVNSFGFAASAAFAAVVKIDAFAYMPAQDFGNAFSTFVAQNNGAGHPKRILCGWRIALAFSTLFCAVSSLLVCLFAEPLMRLFVKAEESDILQIGVHYLQIEGACYVGIGILFLLYGLYRGLGHASFSVVLTVLSLGSRVLLAYLLSAVPFLGLTGIWISVPIGWLLADAVGLLAFRRRQRRFTQDTVS